jgi:hypothetical protein
VTPFGNQTINLPACSQLRHRVPPAQPEILLNSKHQLHFPKRKVLEKIAAGTFFVAVKQVPSYWNSFLYVITNAVTLWDLRRIYLFLLPAINAILALSM